MEQNKEPIVNNCKMAGLRPAMADLEWPPIQVSEQNQNCARILSVDYCGAVSELSAITQYINDQNRMQCRKCPLAKTVLEIAMAEMMHLQRLGELIYLLGGSVNFAAKLPNGNNKLWTPAYLTLSDNIKDMLIIGIESEKAAISQYRRHINMIRDPYVDNVLARIIKDEEYHILLLQALLQEL